MAKYEVARKKKILNPNFPIPPGGDEDFVYDDEFDLEDGDAGGDGTGEDGEDDGEFDELPIPEDFSVVGQVVRTTQGGQAVVDLILEVEDIPGVVQYDWHVAAI
jgi:hypothetical protein